MRRFVNQKVREEMSSEYEDRPENHYCRDIGGEVAYDVEYTPQFGVLQAIALHSKMWPQFSTVNISFMGGTPYQRNIVRHVIDEDFRPLVNLKLNIVNTNGDIVIAFMPKQGAWSALGTDARLVKRGQPTMNLGFLDDNPRTGGNSFGVVKHELGHALGAFLHEHQHPDAGYNWNKEVVIAELSQEPNSWDLKTIERNMFDRYAHSELRSTEYDKESIMHYFFPEYWTMTGEELRSNQFLSDQDKYFLQLEYPHKTNLPISLRDPTTPADQLYNSRNAPSKTSDSETQNKNWLIGVLATFAALATIVAIVQHLRHRATTSAGQSSALARS
jgi:hypothetical protein